MSLALSVILDGLIAAYTAGGPSDFAVIDGEPTDPPRKFLCVGWVGPGEAAVSGHPVPMNMASTQYDDRCEVGCLLSYWDGSAATLSQVRAAAVAGYVAFDAGLAANRLLGGVCMEPAYATAYEYFPDLSREGTLVELRWTVSARAQS